MEVDVAYTVYHDLCICLILCLLSAQVFVCCNLFVLAKQRLARPIGTMIIIPTSLSLRLIGVQCSLKMGQVQRCPSIFAATLLT